MGGIMWQQGRQEEALSTLRTALTLSESAVAPALGLVQIYLGLRDNDAAAEALPCGAAGLAPSLVPRDRVDQPDLPPRRGVWGCRHLMAVWSLTCPLDPFVLCRVVYVVAQNF